MNTGYKLFIVASLALAAILSGCSAQETTTPVPAGPAATAPSKNALGTDVQGEHFSIRLETEPAEPKVGKVKFTATLLHHGTPTENATVKLAISMPTMGHGGPEAELKHVGAGVYSGEVDLQMEGDTQAKITVDQEGHPGEATFDFATQK